MLAWSTTFAAHVRVVHPLDRGWIASLLQTMVKHKILSLSDGARITTFNACMLMSHASQRASILLLTWKVYVLHAWSVVVWACPTKTTLSSSAQTKIRQNLRPKLSWKRCLWTYLDSGHQRLKHQLQLFLKDTKITLIKSSSIDLVSITHTRPSLFAFSCFLDFFEIVNFTKTLWKSNAQEES